MSKIAIWTRTEWAFGQIFTAIKKYSSHKIDLFNWSYSYPKTAFDDYDIVHIPVVQAYKQFKQQYPSFTGKICVSAHSIAELYNYNPETNVRHTITEAEIDTNIIPKEMVDSINTIGSMSCVSQELTDKIKKQTLAKVFYTPCGADEEIFNSPIIEHEKLVVLCPTTREDINKSEHEYNMKRYNLVLEIEQRLPNITFQFLDKRLTMNEISSFYKKGDIILCVSHSEGGPLGLIEAGAMGVLPITTNVGDVSSFIKSGYNGEIVEDNIVENIVALLDKFDKDRTTLLEMRKNIQKTILTERTWKQLISNWDKYFDTLIHTKIFVEIGSNCFETLTHLASEEWRGVLVEPVPDYFNRLEKVSGIGYEQIAIGEKDHPKTASFYYLSNKTVEDNNLPHWATGLGSFSNNHPIIVDNKWEHLVDTIEVPVLSFQELLDKYSIKKIDYLKIDTEGFDCKILKQVDLANIDRLTFEHKHSTPEDLDLILKELIRYKFNINYVGDNINAVKSSTELRKKSTTLNNFTFHLLSLVHLPQSLMYKSCAFTQKNLKLAKMLTSLGHTVYFYGSEGSDVTDYVKNDNFHFVQTHTLKDIRSAWGDGDNRFEIGYDWTNTDFRHDFNTQRTPATMKFYDNCITEINKIKKPDHFLLCTQGVYHKPIADAVGLFLRTEPGVGYRGSIPDNYRAFESSYIQNFTYGSAHPYESLNGSYYDRVIPNYFDPDDVEFSEEKENYILYIGRMIKRKGILTAYLVSEALGIPLKIAGQGAHVLPDGSLEAIWQTDFTIQKGNWEYLGFADVESRKKLMSKAQATFVATEYLECFGGTHVESMLSGTPPITTNFAVFPETIPDWLNGKVGFRCNTLDDFVKATIASKNVDHKFIRQYAEKFLMDNVAKDFDKWFHDLYRVYMSAVDTNKKGWHYISPR